MNDPTELRWQPAGTHATSPTTPSEGVMVQSMASKRLVHDKTVLTAQGSYLVFQVGDEEAVVGHVGTEMFLGDVFRHRKPETLQLSCMDILRLFEEDDPDQTAEDKRLVKQLNLDVEEGEDDEQLFFRALCLHIRDRNLYRSEAAQTNPSV